VAPGAVTVIGPVVTPAGTTGTERGVISDNETRRGSSVERDGGSIRKARAGDRDARARQSVIGREIGNRRRDIEQHRAVGRAERRGDADGAGSNCRRVQWPRWSYYSSRQNSWPEFR